MRVTHPGFWLGPLGGLVALPDSAGSVSSSREATAQYRPLLDGGLVAYVEHVRPMRTWNITIPRVDPEEISGFRELLEHDPLGAWWFVHPHARATNVLTPGMCDKPELVQAGARPVEGGDRVVRSWMAGGASVTWGPVPVVQGIPVTGSAFLSSAEQVTVGLRWLDLAGATLSTTTASQAVPSGTLRRVAVTGKPPAGAVSVVLVAAHAAVVARPAVTWTKGPTEWGPGAGASAVHVAGWSSDLVKAVFDPGVDLRMEDVSFSVQEVRDA